MSSHDPEKDPPQNQKKSMLGKTIYSFGEILWDQFPTYRLAGGSPFNVASHLCFLGHPVHLISAVGDDPLGQELQRVVHNTGLSSQFICVNDLPSGTVNIHLYDEGEPNYVIEEDVAWDYIGIDEILLKEISSAGAFIFASLAQRSEINFKTLSRLLEKLPSEATLVFDCNLRPPFIDDEKLKLSIEWSDIVKCNEGEWEFLEEMFDLGPEELVQEANLEALLLTKGEQGASVFTRYGDVFHQPASPLPISAQSGDFVGVGDAFLAVVTYLFMQKTDWPFILDKATQYAAWVASQKGGTPRPTASFLESLFSQSG